MLGSYWDNGNYWENGNLHGNYYLGFGGSFCSGEMEVRTHKLVVLAGGSPEAMGASRAQRTSRAVFDGHGKEAKENWMRQLVGELICLHLQVAESFGYPRNLPWSLLCCGHPGPTSTADSRPNYQIFARQKCRNPNPTPHLQDGLCRIWHGLVSCAKYVWPGLGGLCGEVGALANESIVAISGNKR